MGDRPAFLHSLAAATAATAVVGSIGMVATVVTAVAIVDQEQNDDDQQDPVAVTATEQITQTHAVHLLFMGPIGDRRHRMWLSMVRCGPLHYPMYEGEGDW